VDLVVLTVILFMPGAHVTTPTGYPVEFANHLIPEQHQESPVFFVQYAYNFVKQKLFSAAQPPAIQ